MPVSRCQNRIFIVPTFSKCRIERLRNFKFGIAWNSNITSAHVNGLRKPGAASVQWMLEPIRVRVSTQTRRPIFSSYAYETRSASRSCLSYTTKLQVTHYGWRNTALAGHVCFRFQKTSIFRLEVLVNENAVTIKCKNMPKFCDHRRGEKRIYTSKSNRSLQELSQ